MSLFPAEEALLVIEGKAEAPDLEFFTIEHAWEILDHYVATGEAPSDLGRDVSKWANWVDYNYTRQRRVIYGTAYYRLNGPATVKGQHVSNKPGFAQIVISVTPTADDSPVVVDHLACLIPFAYQPDAVEKELFLNGATEGIQEYAARHRIVGLLVSILEIHVHEFDSSPTYFKIAAGSAMHAAVSLVGIEAI